MPPLLLLVHRLPFPPDKGDKIRAFQWLQALSARYDVHLGTFIDDPLDHRHLPAVEALCASVHVTTLRPGVRRLCSLRGLLGREPLSLAYYHDSSLRHWVTRTVQRTGLRRALAYSSTMAQYLLQPALSGVHRVVDFVDVDSAKWAAYAATHRGPRGFLYAQEARRLADYERAVAARVSASVFVSGAEAALFTAAPGVDAARVHAIPNGVDAGYFQPQPKLPNPYPTDAPRLVFTGAMDYFPNADAVGWFARQALPAIREAVPACEFFIVGARPGEAVRQLDGLPGVHVTGRVPDVRPWLAHATLAVAPLRIARGIQNKVLEALAMGKPVVGTDEAFAGLDGGVQAAGGITAPVAHFAERVIGCLRRNTATLGLWGEAGRQFVLRHHRWESGVERMTALLEAG